MRSKIESPYFIIYRISGDSGVSDRGTYFQAFETPKQAIKALDDIGSMNDDRCHANTLFISEAINRDMEYEEQ